MRDKVVVSRVIKVCVCVCQWERVRMGVFVGQCESRPQSLRARRRVAVAMKFRLDWYSKRFKNCQHAQSI